MGQALPLKRERWQTKSDGEGASAAEAKCRKATREVKIDKEYERSVYDKFTAVGDGASTSHAIVDRKRRIS